jgi:hypothetical protein
MRGDRGTRAWGFGFRVLCRYRFNLRERLAIPLVGRLDARIGCVELGQALGGKQ